MKILTTSLVGLSAAILLTACGGGGSPSNGNTNSLTSSSSSSSNSSSSSGIAVSLEVRELIEEYEQIQPVDFEPAAFKRISGDELATLLKNGLRMRYKPVIYDYPIRTLGPEVAWPSGGSSTSSSGAPIPSGGSSTSSSGGPIDDGLSGFSDTTVLVAGVDEADKSKYDGQNWYVLSSLHQNHGVNVIETDSNSGSMKSAGEFTFEDQVLAPQDMYIRLGTENEAAEELVVLKQGYLPAENIEGNPELVAPNPTTRPAIGVIYPYPASRSQLAVQWLEVGGAKVTEAGELKYFGSILDSRKIGNQLFLISSYEPTLDGLKPVYFQYYGAADEAQQLDDTEKTALSNEEIIEQASLDDLLAGAPNAAAKSKDCLVTPTLMEEDAVSQLMWVTTIDLETREVTKSECIAAYSRGIYMGPDSLYIGATASRHHQVGWGLPFFDGNREITALHKFSLADDGLGYAASGNVMGRIGWQNPALRMSEHNDYTRIVTTEGFGRELNHTLTILEENADTGTLDLVSTLPNKERPAAIGKPGEDIFATRFFGDRAYVVTYLRIDPLYAIDVSNPKDPEIKGELEIPGFSTFLQPLGKHLLFAIGNTDRRDVKVELFDVRDITMPVVVNTFEFENKEGSTSSEATYEYKALSFLVDGNKARASFPLTASGRDSSTNRYISRTSLELFDIEGIQEGKPSIEYQGSMNMESSLKEETRYRSQYSRSVLHDDTVFFVQAFSNKYATTEAWSASWYAPDTVIDNVLFGEQETQVIKIEK